ncbi:hypothetical protein [Peteryoungia algae]|uniref:Ribulose-1,5-bisphosphate carboxylase/oxygenase large subunit n=1 Tax=Peteryoungia algae TaxID=2919917 RepID=A0ABT0CUR9_9HYPH|nr:hypothetical protein [Rhizobium sp. SSM4.3]MCJ8236913.1 hypothetical protein [Rhizobium sp. SSM4.3]
MIETAATDGDAPSNLTSPQMPHMNWAETSVERPNKSAPARRSSIAGTPSLTMQMREQFHCSNIFLEKWPE